MKLAIIDLDGVIADNTKRMEVAETKREFYRQHLGDCLPDAMANPINHASVQKGFDNLLENLYWQTAFNPELVRFDVLIEGADEALYHVEEELGYHIVFLTSRIEGMRLATLIWLTEHLEDVVQSYDLVMKDTAFQYTKTPVWKAGMVQTLASLYGADDLLVVDDSPDVQKAILAAYPEGGAFGIVRVVESLAEAVTEKCRQCGKSDLPLNAASGLCVRCAIGNEAASQAEGADEK
jgi:hypothetical protein